MKRGWKIFWIVCACIGGIGLLLCIAGAAMGATFSAVGNAYGADSERYVSYWQDWDDNMDYDDNTYVQGSTEDVSKFSGIRELSVDVSYLEVIVRPYAGDDIMVDVSRVNPRLKDKLEYKTDEDELSIETKKSRWWPRSAGNNTGYLVIQVPAGDILREASFEIGAGVLEIENVKADSLDISIGAGEAVVKQFETAELDVECGAGEGTLNGIVKEEASVRCGVGQVNLALNGKQKDYDYQLKYGIGELAVGNDSYEGFGGKRSIDNGTGKLIDIECGVGLVEVTFTEGL
jgi:hypothetical protein